MDKFSSEKFILGVRKRIQKKKRNNAIFYTAFFTIVMCFLLIQSTLQVKYELQANQINEFWYSEIEESIIYNDLRDENFSEEDMIGYLIDSMDINEFFQLIDDFESLYWINDI